jgi:hypothetical protein
MRRQGSSSRRRIMWRTALWWDLLLAVSIAAIFFISWIVSDRFAGGRAYLIGAVPFVFTFATTAWLAGRWLSDRFKEGDYGELLRMVDPDEFEMGYPYQLIAMVGFAGTAWCILAAIIIDGVTNRYIQGTIYAVAVGFVTWSLAGVISLARISFRHQQRAARMRAMKEELEAAARQTKSERDKATEE